MNNKLFKDFIVSIGMLIMFAYGVWVGSLFGSMGYIAVLITGILVFIFLISDVLVSEREKQ